MKLGRLKFSCFSAFYVKIYTNLFNVYYVKSVVTLAGTKKCSVL